MQWRKIKEGKQNTFLKEEERNCLNWKLLEYKDSRKEASRKTNIIEWGEDILFPIGNRNTNPNGKLPQSTTATLPLYKKIETHNSHNDNKKKNKPLDQTDEQEPNKRSRRKSTQESQHEHGASNVCKGLWLLWLCRKQEHVLKVLQRSCKTRESQCSVEHGGFISGKNWSGFHR